jgi:tRNA(Ile)-lysidine synthase
MNDFVRNLLTEWRKLGLPFEDKTFVVAVSGGADSVSLALALHDLKQRKKMNLRFVIAHFNHDLRGVESEEDEKFVKKLAGKYGFELAVKKGNVSKEGNLEQNARNARYNFLIETAENLHAFGILTAHTLNDQAETFLINLIRGSGLEGLGGMHALRSQVQSSKFKVQSSKKTKDKGQRTKDENKSKIALVRPLLNWAKREMTEKYCRDCEIEYRYDTMNEDLAFQRVRIRKVLLPLLKDFNPKIIENLARTSFLLQEDFQALEKISELGIIGFENLLGKSNEKNELEIKPLKNLFPSMRRKILRDWLKNQRGNLRSLDFKHIEALENLIFSRKSGKMVELPDNEFVVKENGKIAFTKKKS